jgi:hypothetical protein
MSEVDEGRSPDEGEGGSRTPASLATRRVTLTFDRFARESVEAHAGSLGVPVSAIVSQAALYFLAARGEEHTARKIPRFARGRKTSSIEPGLELSLQLQESDWSALDVEGVRQHASLEGILEHATMVFLADLDAGRAKLRVVGEGD